MLSVIVAEEKQFNELLPAERLVNCVPAALIASAHKWSETVWAVAEQLGPIPLTRQQVADGNKLAQNPVFVCGVHRSGTTLLKDILDGHPDLVVLPSEGTYYTNLELKLLAMPPSEWAGFLGREWLRRLANPINQPPYWLLGRSDDNHSPYLDFARYVMAWWTVVKHEPGTQWPHMAIVLAYASCTNNLAAKYWVDKTPTNERFINRIHTEMPLAKIIHIIRHPIATLTSRKQMEPFVSLRSALHFLKSSFSIAAEHMDKQRYFVIRYEDLCNEPEAKTSQIASFLDIKVLATFSQTSVAGKPSSANSSFNNKPEAGSILKPHQHRQQTTLTPTERQLVAAVMYGLAKKHNYQLQQTATVLCLFLKLIYRIR